MDIFHQWMQPLLVETIWMLTHVLLQSEHIMDQALESKSEYKIKVS